MTVASLPFLAFAASVAVIYNLARPLVWRQSVLLVANAAFLATFAPGLLAYLPLLGFLAAGYACVLWMQRPHRDAAFWVALAAIIALFLWLKRYTFLPQASFLGFAYTVIGLSYIFFRTVHVVIDAHSGNLPGAVRPVGFFNYVATFTSLVSGPIQRYQDYAEAQLAPTRPALTWPIAGAAIERTATGFFKVIVLSAVLNGMHLRALAGFASQPDLRGHVAAALIVGVSYTFYLYCNFSGYTDIVIGTARFYRLELPENFDRPFSATSFIDFWARWHMTLSGWLKTYVYNPLVIALMTRWPSPRAEPFLGVAAFFVTFFLIGLWHGQTSIFAFYGVLLGLGVSGNKLYQVLMARLLGRKRYRALAAGPLYRALARGLTFTFFTISLFFFWGTWKLIGEMLAGLGGLGCAAFVLALFGCASIALAAGHAVRTGADRLLVLRSRYLRTIWVTAIGAVAVTLLLLMASPAPDVVYKTF